MRTALVILSVAALRADFTLTETSQTAFPDEMKKFMPPAALAKLNQPRNSKTVFKGNRSASIGGSMTTVTDLDSGTYTLINHTEKTYAVSKLQGEAGSERPPKTDVALKATGRTKIMLGLTAKEHVLDLVIKDAAAGGMPPMKHVMWFASVPGAEEARAFGAKLLQKEVSAAGFDPGVLAAFRAFAKIEGIPVEKATQMGRGGSSTLTVTGYSSAPVDPSVFAVPAGYRQVKPEEFFKVKSPLRPQ